jgi:hypothetical protein
MNHVIEHFSDFIIKLEGLRLPGRSAKDPVSLHFLPPL